MKQDSARADPDIERDGEALRQLIAEVQPLLPESQQKDPCAVLEFAVQQQPEDLIRYRALTWAYLQQKKTDLALQTLHRAFAAGADDEWTYRLLGIVHAEEGNFKAAVEAGQQALVRAPDKREALRDLCSWQLQADQADGAETTLARLVEVAPGWPTTLASQAALAYHQNDWVACERYCRQALELDPEHAVAWLNLGGALTHQGQRWSALRCYLRATACGTPRQVSPHLLQGLMALPEIALTTNLQLTATLTWIVWRQSPVDLRLLTAASVGGIATVLALTGYRLQGRFGGEPDRRAPLLARLTTGTGTAIAFLVVHLCCAIKSLGLLRLFIFGLVGLLIATGGLRLLSAFWWVFGVGAWILLSVRGWLKRAHGAN
jgi:Tfp pilus assembly protein PilF